MKVWLLAEAFHLGGDRSHFWGKQSTADQLRWFHFPIHHRNDKTGKVTKHVGYLRGTVRHDEPDRFKVGYVQLNRSREDAADANDATHGASAGAGGRGRRIKHSVSPERKVRPRDVHRMLRQLRSKVPGLKKVSGYRVSGWKAKHGTNLDQEVKIPPVKHAQ